MAQDLNLSKLTSDPDFLKNFKVQTNLNQTLIQSKESDVNYELPSTEPIFALRDNNWLAAHLGETLQFKLNGMEYEEELKFNSSLGIFYFDFYSGQINANLPLIFK